MPSNASRLYQAVLRDKAAPVSLRLRRAFGEWLEGKGLPPPDAGKPLQESKVEGARSRLERRGDCGRFLVEEQRGRALLRTRVTYAESVPRMTGWVVVTVEEDGESGAGQAPGFLPAYLRTAQITDGAVHLTDAPDVVDEYDVPRLIHTLAERDRRVPFVVVAADPQDPRAASARAGYLAAVIAGAGVVVRLADLRALQRFNDAVGPDLGVFGGGIRTYVAPFDPKTENYPYRHRPMGGGMLRSQGDQALDLAAEGIIGETSRRPLPDDVQRAFRIVSRVLAGKAQPRDIADAVAARPASVDRGREDLRRRMMALTVRPAPVPGPSAFPGGSAPHSPSDLPGSSALPTAEAAARPVPEPQPDAPVAPLAARVAAGPVFDVTELARTVAGAVAAQIRGELEAALDLAASAGGKGSDSGQLLRQMRTLQAHVDGLREVVLAQQRGTEAEGEMLLAEAEGESDRLSDEMERLSAEHEILQSEYAESVALARKFRERVRWLESRLALSGHPAYGLAPETPGFDPAGLVDTLNMAREALTHVEIGDTDTPAARLDLAYPTLARAWAAKAWDALQALDSFATARSSGRFVGGFFEWCRSDAADHTIPSGMVAMSESQTVNTNGKYSASRIFSVPPEVHPSGRVLMEAHIKIRKGGCPAPRIHFYDDSGGATGKIWIGHVGDHLPNTRTN
ncbi:hypothetical protein AB0B89_01450 [Sphaerisporangium sp. NPDC049002]|uniref:hypothetical protein n=1 Tax=Sphaerisporangium sp. NPDC049002 TaxID=3155392 RepID=UPI0033D1BB65